MLPFKQIYQKSEKQNLFHSIDKDQTGPPICSGTPLISQSKTYRVILTDRQRQFA